ncbi:MAG: hypothetical protein CMC55_04145 [Flavobacteriaceae bacterium]|nr:hypothetical protein [Flavobacteriaceae bacterium]|tara:strand:- start:443 stop:706 length:264 start_codon:yes stop_codon:yes gene_type:complete
MVVYEIPAIMFISAVAYFFLAWGYKIKDFVVIWLGSLLCFGLGIYISTQGVQELNNFLTVMLSSTNFALGAYFSLRSLYELLIVKNI